MALDPISRVSPSRRTLDSSVGAARSGVDLAALDGVGLALRRRSEVLAQQYNLETTTAAAEQTLANAYTQRSRQIAEADARVRLIRMESEFAREQTLAATEAGPGAGGFTNARTATARERADAFMASLPDDPILREQFAP